MLSYVLHEKRIARNPFVFFELVRVKAGTEEAIAFTILPISELFPDIRIFPKGEMISGMPLLKISANEQPGMISGSIPAK